MSVALRLEFQFPSRGGGNLSEHFHLAATSHVHTPVVESGLSMVNDPSFVLTVNTQVLAAVLQLVPDILFTINKFWAKFLTSCTLIRGEGRYEAMRPFMTKVPHTKVAWDECPERGSGYVFRWEAPTHTKIAFLHPSSTRL